jgi:hypothetical protein
MDLMASRAPRAGTASVAPRPCHSNQPAFPTIWWWDAALARKTDAATRRDRLSGARLDPRRALIIGTVAIATRPGWDEARARRPTRPP